MSFPSTLGKRSVRPQEVRPAKGGHRRAQSGGAGLHGEPGEQHEDGDEQQQAPQRGRKEREQRRHRPR